MNDLISRQDAIELVMQYCPDDDGACSKADEDIRNLLDELENLPSAQPEQKKGKWIIEEINKYELSYGTTAYEPVYRCAACGRFTASYLRLDEPIMPEEADFPRFCPWCGAKMEVEE